MKKLLILGLLLLCSTSSYAGLGSFALGYVIGGSGRSSACYQDICWTIVCQDGNKDIWRVRIARPDSVNFKKRTASKSYFISRSAQDELNTLKEPVTYLRYDLVFSAPVGRMPFQIDYTDQK